MNVCMFARALPAHSLGGMEINSLELAVTLARQGVGVTIVTTAHPEMPKHDRQEHERGVKVLYLGRTAPGVYSDKYCRRSANVFLALHAREPFAVVHSHNSGALGLHRAGALARAKVPLVVTWYGTHWDWVVTTVRSDLLSLSRGGFRAFRTELWDAVSRYVRDDVWLTRAAERVIALDSAEHAKIRMQYFLAASRVDVIFTGVDTERFSPGPKDQRLIERWNIGQARPLLLVLARLIREKGVHVAIDALPAVAAAHPRAHLLIVGDGPLKKELLQRVYRRGLAEHVTFAGEVEYGKCPDYFRACDVFLNPTLQTSGYDTTLAEAMACARVVVTSAGSGTRDIIRSGFDGLIVRKGSAAAVAGAVQDVMRNPWEGRRMALAGRRRIEDRFSLRAVAAATRQLYRDVRASFGGTSGDGC